MIRKFVDIRPVSYYWNKGEIQTDKIQFGFIAQEVEDVLPERGSTATDSMQIKFINYQILHALSIQVIQS